MGVDKSVAVSRGTTHANDPLCVVSSLCSLGVTEIDGQRCMAITVWLHVCLDSGTVEVFQVV